MPDVPHQQRKLRHGWINDETVERWLAHNREALHAADWALITAIDSHTSASMLPSMAQYAPQEVAPGVARISIPVLEKMVFDDEFLNGFDEVWLATGDPPRELPRPPFVLQGREFDAVPEEALAAWMQISGCVVGVGDGWGLGFVVVDTAGSHSFRFDAPFD